jgi:GLPGLI family protein
MNIRHTLILSFLFLGTGVAASAQKILSEGAVYYDVSVQTGSNQPQMADMFDGAKAVLWLRGSLSRTELISALGSTATIFDHRNGNGLVLRDFGTQKLLIRMNQDNWADKNRKYEGIEFRPTGETKTIAGYRCEKADATLKDGTKFTVFYTKEVVTENTEYDPQFKNLPGLALEYESVVGNLKVRYTASKVSFDPVPMQKFEAPKSGSGYRELTYEESVKKNSGN